MSLNFYLFGLGVFTTSILASLSDSFFTVCGMSAGLRTILPSFTVFSFSPTLMKASPSITWKNTSTGVRCKRGSQDYSRWKRRNAK